MWFSLYIFLDNCGPYKSMLWLYSGMMHRRQLHKLEKRVAVGSPHTKGEVVPEQVRDAYCGSTTDI